jgi:hypothetical protein
MLAGAFRSVLGLWSAGSITACRLHWLGFERSAGGTTAAALGLLDKFYPGRPVRLLSVRAEFEPA